MSIHAALQSAADGAHAKRFIAGTHRGCAPSATLDAMGPLGRKLGVTRLANVTGLDRVGVPVVMAVRPNARSLAVSQGKGIDLDSAKASALMETIELWHAEHLVVPLRHDSARALACEDEVIDLDALPLRPHMAARDDVAYEWLAGEDLLTGRRTWVPYEAVSMNTVLPDERQRTFAGGTNGLASGNGLLEATVHGLAELIERDAVTLFHLLPPDARAGRRIALETMSDAGCAALAARITAAGLDLAVWDVTSDIGVPTYLAAIADRTGEDGVARGYGAHLDATVAFSRAVTEAAQARLTLIAGSRDDNLPARYARLFDSAVFDHQRAFYFDEPPRRDGALVSLATDDFADDLRMMIARLTARGIARIVAVDLSRATLGVPVVKVFACGLEGYLFAPDYRPGPRGTQVSA